MFEKDDRPNLAKLMFVAALALLLALPAFADSSLAATEEDSATEGDESVESDAESKGASSGQASGGSGIEGSLSKLSVHGFLTQAWADADFVDVPLVPGPFGSPPIPLGASPSNLELSLGIPEDGTTNYRFLALQFRYEISEKDVFVVQFSSRTLGFSPIQDFEDEIELDWAFYERRLTDNTSLKVGRVQIPFGIYNEFRDVGTILPFYRPAFVLYKEGSFTTETVDGVSLSHSFFSDSDWNLEVTAYAGEWESVQLAPNTLDSGIATAKDGYGYHLWLSTPLPDVRIGTGLISFRQEGGAFVTVNRQDIFIFSLDATFGRFTLQYEYNENEVINSSPAGPITIQPAEWYVLAGFQFSEKFRLWVQQETAEFDFDWAVLTNPFTSTSREDLGVSLNYFFAPNLVLKGEYHWVEEEFFDFFPGSPVPPFFPLIPVVATAEDGSYAIVSLSVSF